jgi:hypothetical protein
MNSKQEYPGSFKCAVGRDKLLRQLMATSEICPSSNRVWNLGQTIRLVLTS